MTQTDPFDFVIVGATGDLTMRKLLPAFYQRFRLGQAPEGTQIIGVARSKLSSEEYRERGAKALKEFVPSDSYDAAQAEAFLELVQYASLDAADKDADWSTLKSLLDGHEDRPRVFYIATAPNLYVSTAAAFADKELISPHTRIVLEKPIGVDLASAEEINTGVGRYFSEEQIFRIDHYLGKTTVQNVLALRFANPMLERSWNSGTILSVQITAAETVGVGARGPYYDTSGALRDMVQNHLLQVLSLVAMEPPASLTAADLRDEKLKVLRALKPMSPEAVAKDTVRAQYVAGEIDGKAVDGYLTDLGDDTSTTETFLAIRTEVRTPRWFGVPFYLRTGKRLAEKATEIVITFRPQPWPIFQDAPKPSRLVLRVQPHEGVSLTLSSKDPSKDEFRLREATLDVSYPEQFHTRYPDSYEELLMDAVQGDPVLFIRRDEVQASWRWVEPILAGWKEDARALETYKAGTWGPDSSKDLLARDGSKWLEDF
ncbi:glucose-6-phosphate dehydrogenase [Acetobacter sp. DsW_063]|uniref:glucose-6-phosphate dehydrogenase n=1 Tax=Acetobacter sp. DsW_063 TaxID=1514894 RepID=UPI000A38D029|nr:glucose-6-phosphate dehydrogenase [Acetobacter sp. DsW_063]OUJ14000.1 glucose-6-phosphate dehydrogenase [Acetobacter sp. DsW_063]